METGLMERAEQRDGRDCIVVPYDEKAAGIFLAIDRSWDDRTYDMGNGVRVHVHELVEGTEADWEEDDDGYVPAGYVYSEMDIQDERGQWQEDAEGACVGYRPDQTLGQWLEEVYGL